MPRTRSSVGAWTSPSLEEIKRLKYRYFRSLDLKEWDAFGDCLAEDVSRDVRHPGHGGAAALRQPGCRRGVHVDQPGPGVVTMHVAQPPRDRRARARRRSGSWGFEDTVIVPDFKVLIRGAGYYHDTYRRDADGAWRIASTGYERIYEAMTSLEDTPSFKLIANRWDPDCSTEAWPHIGEWPREQPGHAAHRVGVLSASFSMALLVGLLWLLEASTRRAATPSTSSASTRARARGCSRSSRRRSCTSAGRTSPPTRCPSSCSA